MKIKQMNRFLLWFSRGSLGITLFPFGIYINPIMINTNGQIIQKNLLSHEKIHWKQQIEMLCIFFYLWYGIEWLIKLPKYGKLTYYAISFEREAYYYDMDKSYLERRKFFAWTKYIYKIK